MQNFAKNCGLKADDKTPNNDGIYLTVSKKALFLCKPERNGLLFYDLHRPRRTRHQKINEAMQKN